VTQPASVSLPATLDMPAVDIDAFQEKSCNPKILQLFDCSRQSNTNEYRCLSSSQISRIYPNCFGPRLSQLMVAGEDLARVVEVIPHISSTIYCNAAQP
jgi:hypothetical protein